MIVHVLLGFTCCVWAAFAQQEPVKYPSKPFAKRFSVGLRGGPLFNSLMSSRMIPESKSTTDPPFFSRQYSNSASKRYMGGPTVHCSLTDRVGLVVDFLYRRTGYDAGHVVVEQAPGGNEGNLISAEFERTRADYWDVPILLRYYNKSLDEEDRRVYIAGGIAFRTPSGIKTFQETVVDKGEGLSDTNSIPIQPANATVPGAVLGVGLQLRDEVGLKIDLEVRYTRWLRRTFESGPTRSNLNQGEFVLGLSF